MSVYNVESYVDMAVKSILVQTFTDFEFLIIDDASNDGTWVRLEVLSESDKRIRLWRNDTNQGVASCINYLLPLSNGEYIARMDGDDISVPDRFNLQLRALEVGVADVCGGWMLNFDEYRGQIHAFVENNDSIRATLLFQNSFCQPTLMMRRSVPESVPLRTETIPAADYDFFVRIPERYKMHNLPVILLYRRMHAEQISQRRSEDQIRARGRTAAQALANRTIYPTEEELRLHNLIYSRGLPENWEDVVGTGRWLSKLHAASSGQPKTRQFLVELWYRYCLKATRFGFGTYLLFRRSSLNDSSKQSFRKSMIIFSLSFLRIRYRSRIYNLLFSLTNEEIKRQKMAKEEVRKMAELVKFLNK